MRSLYRWLLLLWAPFLMYLGYGLARINGIKGETDLVGISAVMRIVFLSFGGGVAYFLTILAQWEPFRSRLRTGMWHAFTAWSLAMLIDDAFMVHEKIGYYYQIKDSIPMLLLGVWLLVILAVHRRRMIRNFWLCFAGFSVLSVIAIFGDVLTGREGTVMIVEFEFDYEMVCEVAAVALLVAGLAMQAGAEICAATRPDGDAPSQTGSDPNAA